MAKGLLRMGPTYGVTAVQPNGAQLQKISDLAADGKVKVILDRTYPLMDAPYAHFPTLLVVLAGGSKRPLLPLHWRTNACTF